MTFVDGKPNGMLLGWYPSGQTSFVGRFRDGSPMSSLARSRARRSFSWR